MKKQHLTIPAAAAAKPAPARRGPATHAQLDQLWRDLLSYLLRYMTVTPPEKRTASMIGEVRMFLKEWGPKPGDARRTQADREKVKALALDFANLPFTKTKQ